MKNADQGFEREDFSSIIGRVPREGSCFCHLELSNGISITGKHLSTTSMLRQQFWRPNTASTTCMVFVAAMSLVLPSSAFSTFFLIRLALHLVHLFQQRFCSYTKTHFTG
mmetsp:Transcript_28613/g.45984  ORF Transcript_28613/g.45984 Transcript_28613/m.45984 type:complete len:110 (+) Transcript_28613:346-675(+)